jgi:uncharacterized protein YukE
MSPLEFVNKYVVLINSLILILLVFKYLQDLRRAQTDYRKLNLEHEKLKYELDKLRSEMQKSERLVVEASAEQINKYVIEPLSEEINRAARELGGTVESFRQTQSDWSQRMEQTPVETRNELKEISIQLSQIAGMMDEIRIFVSKLQKGRLWIGFD